MNYMTPELQQKIEAIIHRHSQGDDSEVLSQLKKMLFERELQDAGDREAKNITELVEESICIINEETGLKDVVTTGFEEFDTSFGGFRLGELVVVGGRPAMGKTQFLVNLALHISQTNPVLYVTLDLSELSLTSRFMSTVSGIATSDILQKNLDKEQKNRLSTIAHEFTKRQLFIHDCCNCSVAVFKAHCQKLVQEYGVQVIIVDYLQLMTSHQHRHRELEVSYISRELKNMAKAFHICIIASSQLSRALETRYGMEGKRPQLSDLRESGAIEQDADKVLFIHRPEYYGITEDAQGHKLTHQVEIIVAKNRNGRMGAFWLERDNDFTTLRNIKTALTFSPDRLRELDTDTPF